MSRNRRASGFSLIELMIALAISVVILAALSATFVGNSRARNELDKAAQQIENGRYAMMTLADDLQLAGYLSFFNIVEAGLVPPATKPDPCELTPAELQASMMLHVQGYDGAATVSCFDNDGKDLLLERKPGTDVLVIRRVSTCVDGAANCTGITGAPYFQASLCANELNTPGNRFRLDTDTGNFTLTRRDCSTRAEIRRFLVHIYFIATDDEPGDGMPTLKRIELLTDDDDETAYELTSLANGIEDLQFEYGLDYTGPAPANVIDGEPDAFTADPDRFDAPGGATGPFADCAANTYSVVSTTGCTFNWFNVVTVKIHLLARNPLESRDHADSKIYQLGLDFDGEPHCALDQPVPAGDGDCDAFGDAFKRHVYQSVVRVHNAAARREQ